MDFQLEILKFFQSMRTPILNSIFLTFTKSAELPMLMLFIAIMYWCINKKQGQRIIFALIGNSMINTGIKEFVKAPRPIGKEGLKSLRVYTATGYSFPSGHTQSATAFWVSLMRIFKSAWIYLLGSIMIIGVAVSRLYLAVHWPIDVICGFIFGVVFTIILDEIFKYVDKTKNYKLLLIVWMLFLVFGVLLKSRFYIKVLGVITGFVLGYIVEDKFIRFSTINDKKRGKINFSLTNNRNKKFSKPTVFALRLLVGMITLGLVYIAIKYLGSLTLMYFALENDVILSTVINYFRYFLVVFYAVAGVPALFKILKLEF